MIRASAGADVLSPTRSKHALLEDAQELDLEAGGMSPTSSRKSVAALRQLEAPDAVAHRAR